MNDRYEHLLRKSRDAKSGGHDAWAVQSTGEKVAVALVLNRADWLSDDPVHHCRSHRAEWRGVGCNHPAGRSSACGRGVMTMQTIPLHRFYQVSGIIAAILLALLLIGTATGRNTLAWIYLQSTETMTNATHIHAVSLDRLDPTCPQCM